MEYSKSENPTKKLARIASVLALEDIKCGEPSFAEYGPIGRWKEPTVTPGIGFEMSVPSLKAKVFVSFSGGRIYVFEPPFRTDKNAISSASISIIGTADEEFGITGRLIRRMRDKREQEEAERLERELEKEAA